MMLESPLSPPGMENNPVVRERVKNLLRTDGWTTLEHLGLPAGNVEFVQVERDLSEPAQAAQVRHETWLAKLTERESLLREANPHTDYSIEDDAQTGNPTLYEVLPDGQLKRKMWAGTTVTLAQKGVVWDGNKFKAPVYPISYTEWIACYDPRYADAFKNQGLPLPYAGIGVSVLMETTDGFFALTRRGIETPVYPGRLYSPGGGPKPGESSTEALLSEILEETGLERGTHFDPDQLLMLALVSDTHFADSQHARPELVAYLPVKANFRTIEQIQHHQSIIKGQRQEDVWGVMPISTFTPNLLRSIIFSGFEMCPPTEAGLAHAAFHLLTQQEGQEEAFRQMAGAMERLKSFAREVYVPPIKRLPSTI